MANCSFAKQQGTTWKPVCWKLWSRVRILTARLVDHFVMLEEKTHYKELPLMLQEQALRNGTFSRHGLATEHLFPVEADSKYSRLHQSHRQCTQPAPLFDRYLEWLKVP